MFKTMGPAHNHEAEDAMDNNTSSDCVSQRGNNSECNSPEVERKCPQSSNYQRSHESGQRDAWMGYSGVWSNQNNHYMSQQHSQLHSFNIHRHQQLQHKVSSRTGSWDGSSTISSTVDGPTIFKKEIHAQESTEEFARPSSSSQCDSTARPQVAPRRMMSSPSSTGLVDLRNLGEPVDMVSGSNCIPLSENCMRYSLSLTPPESPRQRSQLLKRKPSFGKAAESSTSPGQISQNDEARAEKRRRFTRTTEALQKLGLWDIAIRTGKMIVHNRQLQKEIDQLRQDSKQLMLSVLKNPENDNLKRALITMQARINAQKHQMFQSHNMSAVKS